MTCLASGLLASPVQMTFESGSGVAAFNYYVGPYHGDMDGTDVDLFCVDFLNEAFVGEQWDANLSSIVTSSDLSQTRFGNVPDAGSLYQEAAWISRQFASQPESQWADMQATIWQLFDPAAPTPSSSWWLGQAAGNYQTGEYADFRVITNLAPVLQEGQVQEFLVMVPGVAANPVPEPTTYLLIGLGLVSMGFARKYLIG